MRDDMIKDFTENYMEKLFYFYIKKRAVARKRKT